MAGKTARTPPDDTAASRQDHPALAGPGDVPDDVQPRRLTDERPGGARFATAGADAEATAKWLDAMTDATIDGRNLRDLKWP